MRRPFIMVAPNGARRTRVDHPALPVSIADTVETARLCHDAGADALHLHVRDAKGGHSLDAGLYREAMAEMATRVPGMSVQISTEAVGLYDVPAQLHCLTAVQPAWASIAVRETARDMALAPRLYAACAEQGTGVQHIVYDAADLALLLDWQGQGIVQPGQGDILVVLGRYTNGKMSSPNDLARFLGVLPPAANWMVCAFGPDEHACLAAAAAKGAGLRVGFENSMTNTAGQTHSDNASSVAKLRRLLEGTQA